MGQVGIGDFLQAKIHEAFTVAADRLAQSGEVSVEERVELSGLIGDLLADFRAGIEAQGLNDRELDVPLTLEQVELPDQVEDLPDPEEVGEQFVKTEPIFAVQMDRPFTVVTLEGEVEGDPGDWLALNPTTGELWPINDEVLDDTYVRVESYRTERIVKGGGSCGKSQWALLSKKTGKTLGCHDTKGDAEDQEAAIQISKGSSVMRTTTVREGLESRVTAELEDAGFNPDDFWFSDGLNVEDEDTARRIAQFLNVKSTVLAPGTSARSVPASEVDTPPGTLRGPFVVLIEGRKREQYGGGAGGGLAVATRDFPSPALDLAEELAGQGKTRDEIRAALVNRGFAIDASDINAILDLVGVLESVVKHEFSDATVNKARRVIDGAETDLGPLSFNQKIDLLLDNFSEGDVILGLDEANDLLAILGMREVAMSGKSLVDLVMAGVTPERLENFLSFMPGGPMPVRSVRLEPPSDIARQTAMSTLTRAGPRDMRTTAVERWSASDSAGDTDLIDAVESLGFKVLPARPPIRIKAPIRIDDRSLRSFLMDSIPWLSDIQLIVLDHKRRNNVRGEVSMTNARDLINAVMAGKTPEAALSSAFGEQEVDLTGQKPDDPEAQTQEIADMAVDLLKGGNGLPEVTTMVQDEFPEVDNDTVKAGIQTAVDSITDEALDVAEDDPGREEQRKKRRARRRRGG